MRNFNRNWQRKSIQIELVRSKEISSVYFPFFLLLLCLKRRKGSTLGKNNTSPFLRFPLHFPLSCTFCARRMRSWEGGPRYVCVGTAASAPIPSLCPVSPASLLVPSVPMVRGEHRDCLRMADRILLDSLVTSLSVTDESWGESDFRGWTERHSISEDQYLLENQCVSAR